MCVQVYGVLKFVLGTMKTILQVQYNCPQIYDVNQVMYVYVVPEVMTPSQSSTLIYSHQQSIDQCTAVHTRVPLTGLCQSVTTVLVL